jgi:hypothetical protein
MVWVQGSKCLVKYFRVESVREQAKSSWILCRKFSSEEDIIDTTKRGTKVTFIPDEAI